MLWNISLIFLEMRSSSHLNDNNILYNFKCSVNSFPNIFIIAHENRLCTLCLSQALSSTVLQWPLVLFLQHWLSAFCMERFQKPQEQFIVILTHLLRDVSEIFIWLTCQYFAFPKSILNFIYLPIFYHS